MSFLNNKKILIGVSGGIAAYKIPFLIRLLKKSGAEVKVLATESALHFVTSETLATLSGNPVLSEFFKGGGEWNNHVELGLWADLMLVAPATANTMAKMARGESENLLLASYLSCRGPVYFAPAMDMDMYKHEAVQENMDKLQSYGNRMIPAEHGELASGLIGEGRMAEPESIMEVLEAHFRHAQSFAGKNVLVNAGPTHEKLDPVRFISNYSTGKMGFAIARAFRNAGANVTLVSGPVALPDLEGVHMERVSGAEEMFRACTQHFADSDITVLSAAVSDFRPKQQAAGKIKKTSEEIMHLELVKNPDILASLGQNKKKDQVLVGFALETDNEMENALNKLDSKKADVIVLNSLNDEKAGFGHDTNKITLLSKNSEPLALPLLSKDRVATEILSYLQNFTANR